MSSEKEHASDPQALASSPHSQSARTGIHVVVAIDVDLRWGNLQRIRIPHNFETFETNLSSSDLPSLGQFLAGNRGDNLTPQESRYAESEADEELKETHPIISDAIWNKF